MTRFSNVWHNPHVAWSAAGIYAVLLSYLMAAPNPWWILGFWGDQAQTIVDSTLADYVQHATVYAVLAVVLGWAAATTLRPSDVTCFLAALAHGIGFECLQHFVPGRYSNWTDAVANTVGLCVGAAVVFVARRLIGKPTWCW